MFVIETAIKALGIAFLWPGFNCDLLSNHSIVSFCLYPGEQGTLGTYCQWETFNATCGPNEVVMMKSARFGRMKLNRCLESDFSIGCGSDVLLEADRRCSGRHHCTISIPDPTLHNQQSCPKDMGAYLEASYTCLEGNSQHFALIVY